MGVTWITGLNPEILANEIEQSKKIQADGSVSFEGLEFAQYEVLIQSMLKFPDEVPDVEAQRITWKAITGAGKKGKITPKLLLSEINKLTNDYLHLPIRKYVLSTTISIHNPFSPLPLKETKINNAKIVFYRRSPKRYSQQSKEIFAQARKSIFGEYPKNYTDIHVVASGRTTHEAANKALDAVDLLRGIWNLYLNQQNPWRMSFGGPRVPVNNLILGPIHILHHLGGKIATKNTWWYEPQYMNPIEPYRFKNVVKLNRYLQKVKTRLNRHSYKNIITNAILRYTRALDDRNWNNAFLRLWSILELLTDTGKIGYDKTIDRTSFLIKDRELDIQILRILRKYRNVSVHLDQESAEVETYLYLLKYYVETLIRFHLWNKFEFATLQEASDFMNLPIDENILRGRIHMLKNAIKFLEDKKP